MKRKVVQHGASTMIISLPVKWINKYKIKKGDELEVEEKGNKIEISTEKSQTFGETTIDITDLDRTSIIITLQSLYRMGFETINLRFENSDTTHFSKNKKINVLDIIHKEVNRLIAVEVIKQTNDSCEIKEVAEESIKEFGSLIRRIFLILKDGSETFLKAISDNDINLMTTIETYHDTLTKFVSYCLRILNKRESGDIRHGNVLYHIITQVDKIADIMKYNARQVISEKIKFSKESEKIFQKIHQAILSYYMLYYDYSNERVSDFGKVRDEIKFDIKKYFKKLSHSELTILRSYRELTELLFDMVLARIGLEAIKNE